MQGCERTNCNRFLTHCAVMAALTLLLFVTVMAQAQTLTVVHNFTGYDGWSPVSALTMDQAGNFYGTTDVGGTSNRGTVFKLSRKGSGWILTTLYSFTCKDDGGYLGSGVVFGPDGSLYGTASECGQYDHGTVYRLQPSASSCKSALCPWNETTIHAFTGGSDGEDPGDGNLVFDKAGNFYGATATGGYGEGLVYQFAPSDGGWKETVLYDFNGNGGFNPNSGLTIDNAGNLYGTTFNSDGQYNNDSGVVFEVSPNGSGWTEKTLSGIEFPDGASCGGVVFDAHGNLFGTSGCDSLGKPGGVGTEPRHPPAAGRSTRCTSFLTLPDPLDSPTLDAAGNVSRPRRKAAACTATARFSN